MTDILLDNNMDLLIQNGDFVTGDSEEQIQQLILLASQGSFRNSPLTGVNIIEYIKSRFGPAKIDALTQKIKLQFQYDGYTYVNTKVNSISDIEIAASR